MRKGTQAFVSILSLGLVAAGYQAGQAAEVSNGFAAAAPITSGSTASGTSVGSESVNTAVPTDTASPAATTDTSTSTASSAPATSSAPASTPKATTAAPAPASTPKATSSSGSNSSNSSSGSTSSSSGSSSSSSGSTSSSTGTTKTGTAVPYRFGTVQVSVTKANGKITAVNLLQAGATGGREAAFSYLVSYAIQANGSSFGNLSGATFTVDAFKQSLESALAKF